MRKTVGEASKSGRQMHRELEAWEQVYIYHDRDADAVVSRHVMGNGLASIV